MEDFRQTDTKKDKFASFSQLTLFSLCTLLSGLSWICFAPIADVVAAVYDQSLLTINYLSMSFMIFYLLMNFPASYILDRYGLRFGLIIGFFIQAVGICFRCFINQEFKWVIFGQTLIALGQPFTYNAPAKLSSEWFQPKHRTTATMVAVNANIIGNLLGFYLPPLFIKPAFNPDADLSAL
jgi:MFS family permease